ncbi:MAG: hypothetical protein PHC66_02260 [Candidatus Nanoarchaeia archaeon]|nr:hypothetical protein [Candidatus Nanoarchaeia archaeon]MDD5239522.1 hypothetical protein [Candidatus Nanoarchaeia archaeon]
MATLEKELNREHNPESTCPGGMPYRLCGNRGYRCSDCGLNPDKVVYHNTSYDRNMFNALFTNLIESLK